MNLTKYSNLRMLFYAVDEKAAQNFLVALCTTSQLFSEWRNYHISKVITATDLMVHPDLYSIEVRILIYAYPKSHNFGDIKCSNSSGIVT